MVAVIDGGHTLMAAIVRIPGNLYIRETVVQSWDMGALLAWPHLTLVLAFGPNKGVSLNGR